MLELAILGLLKDQDMHGYELKKRLGETLGVASGVSFGSLYPALGRLERTGAVRTVEAMAALADPAKPVVIPQTGSLGGELAAWRARSAGLRATGGRAAGSRGAGRSGRSRKVYGITGRGESLFEELLAAEQATGDDSRVFHLRLAFARYLSADARLGMLERRRAHLLDRLSRDGAGRAGRRIDAYVRSLMEHDRESTRHDLDWIEGLIADERGDVTRRDAVPGGGPGTRAPGLTSSPAAPRPGDDHELDGLGAAVGEDPTTGWALSPPMRTAAAGAAVATGAAAAAVAAGVSGPSRAPSPSSSPAAAGTGTSHARPRRGIAPPTLSGLRRPTQPAPRPATDDNPRPEGRSYQEEPTR